MNLTVDHFQIRQAVERIEEDLDEIEADRNLSTPQTIALYTWLLDYEPLNQIEPIQRLQNILIASLDQQIITRRDLETMKNICLRFLDSPKPAGGWSG